MYWFVPVCIYINQQFVHLSQACKQTAGNTQLLRLCISSGGLSLNNPTPLVCTTSTNVCIVFDKFMYVTGVSTRCDCTY